MLGKRRPPGDGGTTCIGGTFVALAGFGAPASASDAAVAPDAAAGAAAPAAP